MTAAPLLDLDAIHARCDAATAGPWQYGPGHISYDTQIVTVDGGEPGDDETETAYDARVHANAEFVTAARTDVPALLAALAAETERADVAQTDRDRLTAELENARRRTTHDTTVGSPTT